MIGGVIGGVIVGVIDGIQEAYRTGNSSKSRRAAALICGSPTADC